MSANLNDSPCLSSSSASSTSTSSEYIANDVKIYSTKRILCTLNQIRSSTSKHCNVCGRNNCILRTHQSLTHLSRKPGLINSNHINQRERHLLTLMNSSFSLSYAFNPLHPTRYQELGCSSFGFPEDIPTLNGSVPEMHAALQTYLVRDVQHNVAFEDPSGLTFDIVTADWLRMCSASNITVYAMLTTWAFIEHGWNPSQKLWNFALQAENKIMRMLRQEIASQTIPSDNVIFAASSHLMCVNYWGADNKDLRGKILDGVENLINQRGGFQQLCETAPDGLIQNILWGDSQVSFLNGTEPRFKFVDPPTMPSTFVCPDLGSISSSYTDCTGPDILTNVYYMRLLLLFTRGNTHVPTSRSHFRYLTSLFRYVDIQLCVLQARYNGDMSTSEGIVLGMCLVRLGGMTRWRHHTRLAAAIMIRLAKVLEIGLEPWIESNSISALVWICVLAMTSQFREHRKKIILETFCQALHHMLFGVIPISVSNLENYIANSLKPLLWHPDLDPFIPEVAEEVFLILCNQKSSVKKSLKPVDEKQAKFDMS